MKYSQNWNPHQDPSTAGFVKKPVTKKWWQKLFHFVWKSVVLLFAASLFFVVLYRFVPVPLTPLMVIRSVESVFVGEKTVGISHRWVPLEEMNKSIQRAVIKAEDYRFYEHSGFDWDAIEKAMKFNKTHKRKKGASTISQQTAKNVFLWPSRSWIRKGLEAYFTVLIEFFWPKQRILEVYLNVIELGSGVYGVEAASQKFFKKSAKTLNNSQASLLAAVLPNPRRFKVDRPSAYVLKRQAKIMNRSAAGIPTVVAEVPADNVKSTQKVPNGNSASESASNKSSGVSESSAFQSGENLETTKSISAEEEQGLRDYIDLKLDSDPTEPDTDSE